MLYEVITLTFDGVDWVFSFDTTVDLGGVLADDEDLVAFNGAVFAVVFDGSLAGPIPVPQRRHRGKRRVDRRVLVTEVVPGLAGRNATASDAWLERQNGMS